MRRFLLAAAAILVPAVAAAQSDSLRLGGRIRVTVAATAGYTSLFVGNLDRLTPDTLVMVLPGGKGSIILPRAAISDVSVSAGRESRLRYAMKRAAPIAIPTAMLMTLPQPKTPHWAGLRNQRYALVAAVTIPLFTRTPPERWEPNYAWIHHR